MSDTLPGDRFGRTGHVVTDEPEREGREEDEAREQREVPELPDRFGAHEGLRSEVDSELEYESELEPESESDLGPESESELEHEAEPGPVSELAPVAGLEPESELEPEADPVTDPEPDLEPEPTPIQQAVPESEAAPVLTREATSDFQVRWTSIQAEFIDDPRHAVEDADRFVIDVAQAFTSSVESRRRALTSAWAQNGQKETEDLRLTMRQYRALVDRILAS